MDDISQVSQIDDNDNAVAPEQEEVTEREEQETADDSSTPLVEEEEEEEDDDNEEDDDPFKDAIRPGKKPKSAIGVMLLSLCLMGGVGHIYLGQKRKGIFIIILALLASCVGLDFPILIIGAIDAFVVARRLEQRRPIGKWECWWNRRKPQLPPVPDEEETADDEDDDGPEGQAPPAATQPQQPDGQPGGVTATVLPPQGPLPVMPAPQRVPVIQVQPAAHTPSTTQPPPTPSPPREEIAEAGTSETK